MDFDFSAEERQVQEEARRFLSEQCGRRSARQVMESGQTHDAALWQQIAELGWTGINTPERYGGLGLGYLELCLVAEELGRFVAPVPFSSSLYLAAEALLAFGSEDQKTRWLPSIASGELIATLAWSESLGDTFPANPACQIAGSRLNGEKVPVPDGMVAGLAIVLAEDRGEVTLCIVDLTLDGVHRTALKTIDPSRGQARIRFDDAAAEPLAASGGWDAIVRVLNRAAVLFAFEQIGGADACLEMARDFALDRQVFGRQLGSYQAIKHKLADMYVNNQIARSNCYYGAWALSVDDASLPLAAALSRVSAIQAYHYAAKEALHTHGGMGFTWESDCHLFYRRAKQLSLTLGGERMWKDRMLLLARPH